MSEQLPNDDRPVSIVFYKDLKDKDPQPADWTWKTVCETLTVKHYIEESPCTIEEGPNKCAGKSCPYKTHSSLPNNPMGWSPVEIEGKRANANVKFVTLLTFDFDGVSVEALKHIASALASYEHLKYTSHRHSSDDIRFRTVVLLSRKVARNEWHRFWQASVHYLDLKQLPDESCKDSARMYFRPSHPKGAPFEAQHVRGRVLDVDTVLTWANANLKEVLPHIEEFDIALLPEVPDWDLRGSLIEDAITLMAHYFPPTTRHKTCRACAGLLRYCGASIPDCKYIVYEIARQGGSDKPEERAKVVEYTYTRAGSEEEPIAGYTKLCEYVGKDIVDEFKALVLQERNEAFLRNLRKAKVNTGTVQHAASLPLLPASPIVVDLADLRKKLLGVTSKRLRSFDRNEQINGVILQRVIDGKAIGTFDGKGDVETVKDNKDCGIPAEEALRSITGTFAFIFPTDTPWEAVAELLRASIAETPGDDWTEKAEKFYKRSQVTRAVKDAEEEIEHEKYLDKVRTTALTNGDKGSGKHLPLPPSDPPDGPSWQDNLTKGANGAIAQSPYNAATIIRNHPDFCGYVRWNDVGKCVEVHGGPMLRFDGRRFGDIVTGIQDHLASAHALSIPYKDLERRISLISRENNYDPLKGYLNSVRWDGIPRITDWLKTYCGAWQETDEYLHKVGRRWMIALVARGLSPGCKVDNVLVLESPPGAGKSTIFDILGGEFFCDTAIDITNKDAQMVAGKYWICEMAEIVTFKRSGHDALKSFFSSRVDRFRPPYGSEIEESPRRCIWVGTTNELTYLGDETGNRKYWPVSCVHTPGALAALRHDRDQLFAEAVVAYKSGEAWHFDYKEQELTEIEAEKRMIETPTRMQVSAWWYGLDKTRRPVDGVTTMYVATEALGCFPSQLISQPGVLMQIGHALRKMGFERKRDTNGKREWKYYPTKMLLEAPVEPKRRDGISAVMSLVR